MTTQEAQKAAYQNRAAKSREKYQAALAEYNANKKKAAAADATAPAAEAIPSKKRKKSEDGEKKKVASGVDEWCLQIYVYKRVFTMRFIYAIAARFHLCSPRTAKKEQEEGQG